MSSLLTLVEVTGAASRYLHDHAAPLLTPAHDLALRLAHSPIALEASLVLPLAMSQGVLPALVYLATNAARSHHHHH